MTRTDEEGVPTLVQKWKVSVGGDYEVKLFNSVIVKLDRGEVLAHSDLPMGTFSASKETDAINKYVADFWHMIKGIRG